VLIRELKSITDKPVRIPHQYAFPFRPRHGNQVFTAPRDIIGHEFTRRKLLGDILAKGHLAESLAALPNQIEQLKQRAASEQDAAAKGRLTAAPRSAGVRRPGEGK